MRVISSGAEEIYIVPQTLFEDDFIFREFSSSPPTGDRKYTLLYESKHKPTNGFDFDIIKLVEIKNKSEEGGLK